MDGVKRILFAIFFFSISVECINQEFPLPQRPIITYNERQHINDEQIQKQQDDILLLTCRAEYPVVWLTPDNSVFKQYSKPGSRLKIENDNSYDSTLVLHNLQHTDTGFYRCVSKEYDSLKIQKLLARTESRVYVYVNDLDPKHLFLHTNGEEMFVDHLSEISYINCLTTDISATVELFDSVKDKKIDYLRYEEGFGFQLLPGDLEKFCRGSDDFRYCEVKCVAKSVNGNTDTLGTLIRGEISEISISPRMLGNMFYLQNNVTMVCSAKNKNYSCTWIDPKNRTIEQNNPATLSIVNVDWTDEGVYQCSCTDEYGMRNSKNKSIIIRDTKPTLLKVETESRIELIKGPQDIEKVEEFGTITLLTKIRLFVPTASKYTYENLVKWQREYSTLQSRNIKEDIQEDEFFVQKNSKENGSVKNQDIFVVALILKNATIHHSGNYTLVIHLPDLETKYNFFLEVLAEPRVKLFVTEGNQSDVVNSRYLEKERNYTIWCIAEGVQTSVPTLEFSSCVSKPCDQTILNLDENSKEIRQNNATFQKAVVARTVAAKSGSYKCSLNDVEATISYIVNDFRDAQNNEGFRMEFANVSNTTATIYEHTKRLEFSCRTQLYDYEPVKCFHRPHNGVESELLNVNRTVSKFSNQYLFLLENVQMTHAGAFICRSMKKIDGGGRARRERSLHLNVKPTTFLFFGDEMSPKDGNFTFGDSGSIFCDVRGDPNPTFTWYKNGVPYPDFVKANTPRITLENDGRELKISTVLEDHKGTYVCVASNYFNTTKSEFVREVVGLSQGHQLTYVLASTSGILAIVVVALVVAFVISRIKYEEKLKKLRQLQRDFMASADMPVCVKDDVPINEQSKDLPYKNEFELPPIVIPPKDAQVIGKGEYGVVVKSSLVISHPPPPEQHEDAVKVIPNTFTVEEIHSILNEVKIMIHIGDHVNVLNLIGAVTSHLYTCNQKLYIVTEYCALGSLEKLLRNCQRADDFTDELSSIVVKVEHSTDISNRSTDPELPGYLEPFFDKDNSQEGTELEYLNTRQSTDKNVPIIPSGYIVPKFENYKGDESEKLNSLQSIGNNLSVNPNGYIIPPSLENPVLQRTKHRSHWPDDGTLPTTELCTSDLLFYSYQIANGMEFLFSKNVIHRDLATRNILLTAKNITRISDFGLSQEGDVYKMKSQKKLPLRWLPLEAFDDNRFSLFSDIWSFGILLWEIFTLGDVPYSGINIQSVRFQLALKAGLRPSRPPYAPEPIWNLMQQCWSANPKDRPDYGHSKKIIGEELKHCCCQCYENVQTLLNDPKNTPNYHRLRQKLAYVKEAIEDDYELPQSKWKSKKNNNRYADFSSLTKEKNGEINLLRV